MTWLVGPASPPAASAGSSVNVSVARYAVPSGPIEIQGSLVRSSGPPVQREMPGTSTRFHVAPPSFVTATMLLSAPPSTTKRSCCQTAIALRGFCGLTANDGSASESNVGDPGTLQPPGLNGEKPDSGCRFETVAAPEAAGAAKAAMVSARASTRITLRTLPGQRLPRRQRRRAVRAPARSALEPLARVRDRAVVR